MARASPREIGRTEVVGRRVAEVARPADDREPRLSRLLGPRPGRPAARSEAEAERSRGHPSRARRVLGGLVAVEPVVDLGDFARSAPASPARPIPSPKASRSAAARFWLRARRGAWLAGAPGEVPRRAPAVPARRAPSLRVASTLPRPPSRGRRIPGTRHAARELLPHRLRSRAPGSRPRAEKRRAREARRGSEFVISTCMAGKGDRSLAPFVTGTIGAHATSPC